MSLQLRAVLMTGLALVLLWALAAAWTIAGAQARLEQTLDERLAMSARMVSGLLQRSALPMSALAGTELAEAVQVGAAEGMACQIRSLRGEVLAQTVGAADALFRVDAAGYGFMEHDRQRWRTFTLREGEYQIVTADRIDERAALAQQMRSATGIPFLIACVGGLLVLWMGIGQGLSPLHGLRRTLKEKSENDTRPIMLGRTPAELRPLVQAMNDLLARLAKALASQRAFTDAAAHELRTPLTAVDTHLQVLRLACGAGAEADASLQQAEEAVRRLSRTLEQMMALARAEAAVVDGDSSRSVHSVLNEVIHRLPAEAQGRITLRVAQADCASVIPRSLLETAVRNLVDNALRYSPPGSPVSIELHCDTARQCCAIEIADRGPGLAAGQIAQAGRRFWRGDQGRDRSNGSGLGISIVCAIAAHFAGAQFSLALRDGGGLVARLNIPMA